MTARDLILHAASAAIALYSARARVLSITILTLIMAFCPQWEGRAWSELPGTVTGTVRSEAGPPVAGAHVYLTREAPGHPTWDASTAEDGTYAVDISNLLVTAIVQPVGSAVPGAFSLGQNYPNPFNPSTAIPYRLGEAAHVRLDVYNVLGHRIRTLVNARQAAGEHSVTWDGRDARGRGVAGGLYLYRLRAGKHTAAGKMILLDGASTAPAARPVVSPRPVAQPEPTQPAHPWPQTYRIMIVGNGMEPFLQHEVGVPPSRQLDFTVTGNPAHRVLGADGSWGPMVCGEDQLAAIAQAGGTSYSIDSRLHFFLETDSVYDLELLRGLTAITGSLEFSSVDEDVGLWTPRSLTGLEELCFVGGRLHLDLPHISSLAPLANLESVGELSFQNTGSHPESGPPLASPSELTGLRELGGLVFGGFTSLAGLETLDRIWGDVVLGGRFENCAGLDNLQHIYGALHIWSPYLLSLEGLDNLRAVGEELRVYRCSHLTDLEGLGGLQRVGGPVRIWHNERLASLAGWGSVPIIARDLSLIGNPALASLSGLEQLEEVGGQLKIAINHGLTSCAGLDGLRRAGAVFIADNRTLTTLAGLRSLTQVAPASEGNDADLRIRSNPALSSLAGLDALSEVAGQLTIERSDGLESLDGLEALSDLGGALVILNNDALPADATQNLAERLAAEGHSGEVIAGSGGVAEPLVFPDPFLEIVVRARLPGAGEYLRLSDVADLTNLHENPMVAPLEQHERILSLDGIQALPNLTRLDLWSHNVEDARPVTGHTQLTHLRLHDSLVTDLTPLAGLTGLVMLDLGSCFVTDISALAELSALQELELLGNQIHDLSSLAHLPALSNIGLRYNQVQDLSALVANHDLAAGCTINLRNNPLSEAAISEQIPALRARGVVVRY